MDLTEPILQRHEPVSDEREGIIALLSLLYSAPLGQGLSLSFGKEPPIRLGPGALRAVCGLLAVLARPSAASVYVVDEADFYEAPQVFELLGVDRVKLYHMVHSGELPSLRDEWKRPKRAHHPFSAGAVMRFIAEKPLERAKSSARRRTEHAGKQGLK